MSAAQRRWFVAACLLALTAVALGAFGAHGLRDRVEPRMLEVFEVGVRYQMFHALALLAAALADTAAQHQHVDDAAVVHVRVIPVVHRGADDDHRAAVRLVGVVGELARDGDQLLARRAGDALLPGRRVGRVVVEVLGREFARQTARDAVVGDLQVEDGGNERCFAVLA